MCSDRIELRSFVHASYMTTTARIVIRTWMMTIRIKERPWISYKMAVVLSSTISLLACGTANTCLASYSRSPVLFHCLALTTTHRRCWCHHNAQLFPDGSMNHRDLMTLRLSVDAFCLLKELYISMAVCVTYPCTRRGHDLLFENHSLHRMLLRN